MHCTSAEALASCPDQVASETGPGDSQDEEEERWCARLRFECGFVWLKGL